MPRKLIVHLSASLLAVASSAHAATYTLDSLLFKTTAPQNSFGSGAALELSDSIRVTTSWDEDVTVGNVVDLGTAPNPEWLVREGLYQTAVTGYNVANTTYVEANKALRQFRKAYNDCLDEPFGNSVTCSPVKLPIAAATETRNGALAARNLAARERDVALGERNKVSRDLDLGNGGAQARLETSGEVGLKFDYKLTAGEVNPELDYSVGVDAPNAVAAGSAFTINTTQALKSGKVNSISPRFEASMDQILDINLSVDATACAGACVSGTATLVDVDEELELVSVNPQEAKFLDGYLGLLDPSGTSKLSFPVGTKTVQLWQGTPVPPVKPPLFVSLDGIAVTQPTPEPPFIELAKGVFKIPLIETEGEKEGSVIRSEGSDTIADIKFDIDGLNPQLPPGGVSVSFGPSALNAAVTLDAFDIKAGPELDILQLFEIVPNLMVDLQLDKAITATTLLGYEKIEFEICFIPGRPCNSFSIDDLSKPIYETKVTDRIITPWNALPEFMIEEDTTFTPTFFMDATLRSKIDLQLGLGLDVLLGKGSVNLGPLTYEFGPLFSKEFDYEPEFGRFSLFDERFDLLGWNRISGESFTIAALAPVPLPTSIALSLGGLAAFAAIRRRQTRQESRA
jgi:hypothetical protein